MGFGVTGTRETEGHTVTDTYTGPGEFLTITREKSAEVVGRHLLRYQTAVRLSNVMGGRWLDCACGTGYGWDVIESVDPDSCVGIDRSAEAIDSAIAQFAGDHREWGCWDIERAGDWMPIYGPFDVILSLETIEHLAPGTQDIWIEAAADGLTSGGVFVLACPIGNDGPSDYNRYHLHEPSIDGLNALLSRHFKSVEIETEDYVDTGGHEAVQAFAVCR